MNNNILETQPNIKKSVLRNMKSTNMNSDLTATSCSRLSINVAFGIILTTAIAISLTLFVLVPYFSNASHKRLKNNTKFFYNRNYRYDWPPPSYSLMGKFKQAAVTCDHGICSEIGRNIMLLGGNAVESSIASLVCLGVTNPQSSGLGGGFIMTLYNRTTKMCKIIDARETAPMASSQNMFGADEWASKYGYRTIATPGELAGLWLAFHEFGSGRLKWSQLILPSIELARHGVPISEYLAHVLKIKEKHFRTLPSMKSWINNKTDRVHQFGDIIKREKLANTLEKIAFSNDPVKLFYEGEIAEIIVQEIQTNGGIITKEDLKLYRPKIYETPLISNIYAGGFADNSNSRKISFKMCGPPPPSSFAVTQSVIATMIARFGDHVREGNLLNRSTVLDDTEFYHWMIETQKFAYSQRTRLGDIDFVPDALNLSRNMTTDLYTQWLLTHVPKTAKNASYYSLNKMYQKEDHGTSHVSVIDRDGNGVSATSTINRWFGAVVQSESFGIIWNDEMDDFSTPGLNNGFGFAPSEANFIASGKRPMSSMSPMVVFNPDNGILKFVIGASGGSKIISAIAKPIVRILCFNETIKEAIDAPTLHNQFMPEETQYEQNVPEELLKDLRIKFAQKLTPSSGFEGIVQGIHISDDGFIYANGDYRRRSDMHPGGF